MKKWICKICHRRKESEDNIKMFICPGCQEEMEEDGKRKFTLLPEKD